MSFPPPHHAEDERFPPSHFHSFLPVPSFHFFLLSFRFAFFRLFFFGDGANESLRSHTGAPISFAAPSPHREHSLDEHKWYSVSRSLVRQKCHNGGRVTTGQANDAMKRSTKTTNTKRIVDERDAKTHRDDHHARSTGGHRVALSVSPRGHADAWRSRRTCGGQMGKASPHSSPVAHRVR